MPRDMDLRLILDDFRRMSDIFRFTRANFGRALLDAAVVGIEVNCAAEQDPDDNPWDELSPGYAAWKAQQHPGQDLGHLLDRMLAHEQLAGRRTIAADVATMTYGRDDRARQEAAWFQDPTNPHQPPRPFYGITADAGAEMDRLCDDRFDKAVWK